MFRHRIGQHRPKCEECGNRMKQLVAATTAGSGRAWLWNKGKPIELEHINVTGEGPLTFNSQGELRRYCREHKLASGALL